jgi:hypothetical protein
VVSRSGTAGAAATIARGVRTLPIKTRNPRRKIAADVMVSVVVLPLPRTGAAIGGVVLPLLRGGAVVPVLVRSLLLLRVERMSHGGAKATGAADLPLLRIAVEVHGLALSRAVRSRLLLRVRKSGRAANVRSVATLPLGLPRNAVRDRMRAAVCRRLLPLAALVETPVRNDALRESNGLPLREPRNDVLPRVRAASR